MNTFFLYDPEGDGFITFRTAMERDAAAKDAIAAYLDSEGWSEDVERVLVGCITGRAEMCDVVRPSGKIDDEGVDEAGVYWEHRCDTDDLQKCNYRIAAVGPNV